MIHITISVSDKPLRLTLHHFETKRVTPGEKRIAHTLRTLLQPFLHKVAGSFNAAFKIIE
jgi:hypothetical protein